MSVDGVILAAGYSSRAGDFKPGLDLYGKTILQRTIESMSELCEHLIVVGGHQFEIIRNMVSNMPKVKVVKNEHVELGMFFSVKTGIAIVEADRFFIVPGDQPAVRAETYKTLIGYNVDIAIPRYHGKKGHPVLFNSTLIPEILSWDDSEILRNYIHSKDNVAIIDVDDPGIGLDVDTTEDYRKIKEYYKNMLEKLRV